MVFLLYILIFNHTKIHNKYPLLISQTYIPVLNFIDNFRLANNFHHNFNYCKEEFENTKVILIVGKSKDRQKNGQK